MMYGWTGGTGPTERGVQQGVGPFNTIPQVDWTFFLNTLPLMLIEESNTFL